MKPIWKPSQARISSSRLTSFRQNLESRWQIDLPDYKQLHQFSIEEPEKFWMSVWDFCGVIADARGSRIIDTPPSGDQMLRTNFFPEAKLNFARNLLRRQDDKDAIIFQREDRAHQRISYGELYDNVARLAAAFRAFGLKPGDRVAAYLPNIPEAIVGVLATASIGAIWSSCSQDFGVQGVLDRFHQIEPKILLAADGYVYNGKTQDRLSHLAQILEGLPSVDHLILIPHINTAPSTINLRNSINWTDLITQHSSSSIQFESLDFDHPLYILYSSGTTGPPKCLVHSAGGTLLQHLKEHQLHCDIKKGDRVFYFTTLGWMMWNWLITALASEATIILYEGSPFHLNGKILFNLADTTKTTFFGTSATFISTIAKSGLSPIKTHQLNSVRTIASTGSPLSSTNFNFVYQHIKHDVHLASISGGTDIVGCFVCGNPTTPVWPGEIQAKALGMDIAVFNEKGQPVEGEKGELVCTTPFPSMPICFWNDPDYQKYQAAYFKKFPGIWHHGDYAELTAHNGIIIHGRSDSILNPAGVRIGTAEIYREVEHFEEVLQSLVIGQEWDHDTRIVLFVQLRNEIKLSKTLIEQIQSRLRKNASIRHVPSKIIQVEDIPRTKSGKIVELAVREIVHGRPVKNIEALDNPQALELFRSLRALQRQ